MSFYTILVVAVASTLSAVCTSDLITDEAVGKVFLQRYDVQSEKFTSESVHASWDYNTNITHENLDKSLEASSNLAAFAKSAYEYAMKFDWQNFSPAVKREFSKVADIGPAVLPNAEFTRMNEIEAQMTELYSTATVCNKPGDSNPDACYPLDPDLSEIMSHSEDWNELVWAWEGWRNESSRGMPSLYNEFIGLQNEAAKMNGYADNGDYWRSWYESDDFEESVEKLWTEVKPVYEQLHTYVRNRLSEVYSDQEFPQTGHIPAHILGDMWAQQWNDIEKHVLPFPDKTSIGEEVTAHMIEQGYDTDKMFKLSEDFFKSLGLIAMPDTFWTDSMLEKPDDGRDVVCHASAWDFYNKKDFRIKQCTEVNMKWLVTTHHEMGHVEYFLQYKNLPIAFRDGANPGFHEAIGDVLELSVSTPSHLSKIGLFDGDVNDQEITLNALMSMMLKKVAFLPFGYLIDKWRWNVFRGEITQENYNSEWWKLRCDIQGVSSPVARNDALDFDPGSKFHVPANTPYIRYFISHLLQFQFHKALCSASGHTGPLHTCDIYQSLEAGEKFSEMMSVGSSEEWPDVLERLTGSRQVEAGPMVEFFQPVLDWLKLENAKNPLPVGWTEGNCQ